MIEHSRAHVARFPSDKRQADDCKTYSQIEKEVEKIPHPRSGLVSLLLRADPFVGEISVLRSTRQFNLCPGITSRLGRRGPEAIRLSARHCFSRIDFRRDGEVSSPILCSNNSR